MEFKWPPSWERKNKESKKKRPRTHNQSHSQIYVAFSSSPITIDTLKHSVYDDLEVNIWNDFRRSRRQTTTTKHTHIVVGEL